MTWPFLPFLRKHLTKTAPLILTRLTSPMPAVSFIPHQPGARQCRESPRQQVLPLPCPLPHARRSAKAFSAPSPPKQLGCGGRARRPGGRGAVNCLPKKGRNGEIEGGSPTHFPFSPDLAAVTLDDAFSGGQPYADPFELRAVQSFECLEKLPGLVFHSNGRAMDRRLFRAARFSFLPRTLAHTARNFFNIISGLTKCRQHFSFPFAFRAHGGIHNDSPSLLVCHLIALAITQFYQNCVKQTMNNIIETWERHGLKWQRSTPTPNRTQNHPD